MTSPLDSYLARLRFELRRLGLIDDRIVEEARGHLTDATERGTQHGLPTDAAEREAIEQFGTPELVAANFASDRFRTRNRLLLVTAAITGLAIAYVDSRPAWDDAGITAFSMLLFAGVLGFIGPQRPWLWALAIGIWIPLHAMVRTQSPGSVVMLAVLAFPLVGAYAGMAARGVLRPVADAGPSGFHERQAGFHFALRTRRGWVDPELLAIASDPGTHLAPYLARVAPKPLGPLGRLESLTLVEESDRLRTYRVVFGDQAQIICTVALATDGRAVSIDWSRPTDLKRS